MVVSQRCGGVAGFAGHQHQLIDNDTPIAAVVNAKARFASLTLRGAEGGEMLGRTTYVEGNGVAIVLRRGSGQVPRSGGQAVGQ